MPSKPVVCPYCRKKAKLVSGDVIYPHRPDLNDLRFWLCAPCDAYVGCHKSGHGQGGGDKPLGRLANASLRDAKRRAHAAFDPLWQSGAMRRAKAYGWLSLCLGLPVAKTHIGNFDVETCERVIEFCRSKQREIGPNSYR